MDYLREHKVVVYEGQDDLASNEAYEHLSRHIGQHFPLVAGFYEKVKRAVATGRTARIDIDGLTERERSAAVQLGTLLHRHGMLKDFYYHRSPRKTLRVIPTQDGETAQFLTGGWLEIYVAWLLARRLRARFSPNSFQVLFNVKGTLPDGNEFESDIMGWVDGRFVWIECKTGSWQDYSARFKGLVDVFGTDRHTSALLLLRPSDASTRKRATDLLNMRMLALEEVQGFIDTFLGVSAIAGEDDDLMIDGLDSDEEFGVGRESSGKALAAAATTATKETDAEVRSTKTDDDEAGSTGKRRRRRRGGRGRGRQAMAAGEEGREDAATADTVAAAGPRSEGERRRTSGSRRLLEP
ncbi:MAG TPA: hypothetical protein VGC54_13785, partial [Planctomycetota bacterium]